MFVHITFWENIKQDLKLPPNTDYIIENRTGQSCKFQKAKITKAPTATLF